MNYGRVRVHDVIDQAVRLYDLADESGLTGRSTKRTLSKQRQAAMVAARLLGFSLHDVADYFGRDSSTVSHADRCAESDPLLLEDAQEIAQAVCDALGLASIRSNIRAETVPPTLDIGSSICDNGQVEHAAS